MILCLMENGDMDCQEADIAGCVVKYHCDRMTSVG